MEGVISRVPVEQGRGVITGLGDKEYPFEQSDFQSIAAESLVEGAVVEFELEFQVADTAHGGAPEAPRAVNVRPSTVQLPKDGLDAG